MVWNKERSVAKITDFSISSVVVRSQDTDQTQSMYNMYKNHWACSLFVQICNDGC